MYLIAGLGNPSPDYDHTRHNFGRVVVEAWLTTQPETQPVNVPKFSGKVFKLLDSDHVLQPTTYNLQPIVVAPDLGTYMNESGVAVQKLLAFFKIESQNLILVHDDLAFPLGTLRLGTNLSAAGHNGVQSVVDVLGTQDFMRVRLGAESRADHQLPGEHFVLQKLSDGEELVAKQMFSVATKAIEEIIKTGLTPAMNEFNSKP